MFYYGDNDAGTGIWDAQLNLGPQGGAETGSLTGLAPGTTYYFRAAASNSASRLNRLASAAVRSSTLRKSWSSGSRMSAFAR